MTTLRYKINKNPSENITNHKKGGLINVTGNSCFSNALLQALFHCTSLKEDIINLPKKTSISNQDIIFIYNFSNPQEPV